MLQFMTDGSLGYSYYSSRRDAKQAEREFLETCADEEPRVEWHEIDVPLTKDGVLRALNTYGSHPDNG